jgi:hypothetical protein
MKFNVEGADEKTGDERTVRITAYDQDEAERIGRRMGLLVSKVEPTEEPVATSAEPPPTKTVVPGYRGLQVISLLFRVNALLAYTIGGVMAVAAAVFLLRSMKHHAADEGLIAIQAFGFAVAAIFEGMISHGICEFFNAFRDLVRNSFQ